MGGEFGCTADKRLSDLEGEANETEHVCFADAPSAREAGAIKMNESSFGAGVRDVRVLEDASEGGEKRTSRGEEVLCSLCSE
jgi:hypothetical protein